MQKTLFILMLFFISSCAHGPNTFTLSNNESKVKYDDSIEINMPYGEFTKRYTSETTLIDSVGILDLIVNVDFSNNKVIDDLMSHLRNKGFKVKNLLGQNSETDMEKLKLNDEFLDELSKKQNLDSFLVIVSNALASDNEEKSIKLDTKLFLFVPHQIFEDAGGRAGWVDVNDMAKVYGDAFVFNTAGDIEVSTISKELSEQVKLYIDKLDLNIAHKNDSAKAEQTK